MEGNIICHLSIDANRCLPQGNKLPASRHSVFLGLLSAQDMLYP